MMRLPLALGALVLVLIVSSPASATYSLIRWSNGYCSVWSDDNKDLWPTWENYTQVSRQLDTRAAAWSLLPRRKAQKVCNNW